MQDLQRTTDIALMIAREAGQIALGYYGQAQVDRKPDGSLVTQADRQAEELIRERLATHFPDCAVYGEEYGHGGRHGAPYTWYIDPIDGTSNFVYGLPIWGVSLGLACEGRSVAGAFVMPVTGETYWAWEGGGCYLNGRRVSVNDPGEMRHHDLVNISATIPARYDLSFMPKIRCLGSATHALASVAAGHLVAMVMDSWRIHDFAGAMVMCSEAGGLVTYDDGTPFEGFASLAAGDLGPTLIAAGPQVHPHILAGVRRRA